MYIEAMTMKLRTMIPVISLIVTALAGLILLQVYLLNNAFALKEQAFRQNVGAALGAAALKLQAGETLSRVRRFDLRAGSTAGSKAGRGVSAQLTVRGAGRFPSHRVESPQRVSIRVWTGGGDSLLSD